MALPFAGRHCVVVGATGVIGSSIAKAFAQHGAVVSLLGRSAIHIRHKLEPQLRPYSLPETGDGTENAAASADIPSVHRFIRLDASNREEIKALFSSRASSSSEVNTFICNFDRLKRDVFGSTTAQSLISLLCFFFLFFFLLSSMESLTFRKISLDAMLPLDPSIFSSTVPASLKPRC